MNRLGGETSPYLLQHAHNPVDWYPWGPEALERARRDDRPIFLSIGYAACHWCHVMERESFEDPETAAQLNADFVAIKVDREERPDLDAIYMTAVQALTGQGGWPMSVFLTPDGRPFHAGTYFPATPMHGMPAFRQVLAAVADAWRERRAELDAAAGRLATAIARANERTREQPAEAEPASGDAEDAGGGGVATGLASPTLVGVARARVADSAVLSTAVLSLGATFDGANGGWGGAPKFPQPATIEFLLARAATARDSQALVMAVRTLDAMAAGGIADQVGGGFHRYSTDAHWLVPHFEKMLYDNAQLARAYVHAYELTGERRHARVAQATLAYVLRDLVTPDGLFAASQDADTDGIEGATYTWALAEIEAALGGDASLFASAYGVTATGNWEGRTILARVRDDAALASMYAMPPGQVAERLEAARARLLAVRDRRPQPARDGKALASWNGLAIGALADAGRALGSDELCEAATAAADAALRLLRGPDGRLRRSWKDGRAPVPGFLEDHAHLADGLLALYAATFEERWFVAARELAEVILGHFADPAGGFWDTADDHETLFARPRGQEDGAIPSGGAVASLVLLRLAALTGESRYRAAAEAALPSVAPLAARYPTGFAAWLRAIDLALATIDEIAIVGPRDGQDTAALLKVATRGFQPHRVIAVTPDPATSRIELLQSRFALRGAATAFVCRDFSCRQPVTQPEALAAQLVQ